MLPVLTVYNAKGQPETVKYHLVPTLLLNEVQRQQKMIKAQAEVDRHQQTTIQMQAKLVAALERRLRSIEVKLARLTTLQAASHPATLDRRAEAGVQHR